MKYISQQHTRTGIDHSVATALGKPEDPAYKRHYDTVTSMYIKRNKTILTVAYTYQPN